MPFGLTNALATCQHFANNTLQEFLDVFCILYLDDILMYSKSRKEHQEQVHKVFAKLSGAGLFTKPKKYEFTVTKTTFLGFVIFSNGIEMDLETVKAVIEWEIPKSVKDI